MKDFLAAFSARLRSLRASRQESQEDVARVARVSQGTVGNWEAGKSSPSVPELARLCDYYDVSADYLSGRSEFPSGLAPDTWIVDLDALDAAKPGSPWAAKVPRRARLVDFEEFERLRQQVLRPKEKKRANRGDPEQ